MADTGKPMVVLVHGLLLAPWAMKPLGGQLARAGYDPRYFGYRDLRRPVQENAAALADFIRAQKPAHPPHIVAHSLGGLVTLRMLHEHDVSVGRVVALGSPFLGAYTAKWFRAHGGNVFIQKSWDGALDGTGPDHVPEGVELGVVAGTKGLQHNIIVWSLPKPNDGTVSLSETKVRGATDRCEFAINHNALIWTRRAVGPIVQFLENGAFNRPN